MNSKTKRRLAVVTGVIVIVLIVLLAVVGGGTAAKAIELADATSGRYIDQRVQVSGSVVKDSYAISDNVLSFAIYDPDNADAGELRVDFDGTTASTFGNDVEAICTGKIGSDGILRASEMVTKCPSKYESGTEALGVVQLFEYGDDIVGTTVRVTGNVATGTQKAAGQGIRFVLADESAPEKTLPIRFDGAASEETLADGAVVVITGDLDDDKTFSATDVSLRS